MLSKTFIDERYSKSEDLLEYFTISNIINKENKTDKNKNLDNNIETNIYIFTPYISTIVESSIKSNNNRWCKKFKNNIWK